MQTKMRFSQKSKFQSCLLILLPFHHFTYITAHSPTLLSLYLCHSSFSKPSVALPTSQLILQPFFRFSYSTCFSLTSSGKSLMQTGMHMHSCKEGVCENNAVQFQSCNGSSYFTALGENGCTDICS